MTNAPAPTPQPAYAPEPKTNTWSIVAIITVWFGAIFGLVFGYIALSQIKRTGEGGRGLALAAVIIGWVLVGLGILTGIIFSVIFGVAIANNPDLKY